MVIELLELAKFLPKNDYLVYSKCKRVLKALPISDEAYAIYLNELIKILEI